MKGVLLGERGKSGWESGPNAASHYNLCQDPSILPSAPPNLVRAQLSFRVSVPPRRHLQINEKCHIWFHSSRTAAPELCHKLSLLFWSLAGPAPDRRGSVLAGSGPLRLSQGKPTDNDLPLMLLEQWFLIFSLPACSASLILVLEWLASEQEVGGGLQWRGNKELVKWRGVSFSGRQRGIVFNPWLCGSPRMPSLLLSLPQRQGIKDTLHLFYLVC